MPKVCTVINGISIWYNTIEEAEEEIKDFLLVRYRSVGATASILDDQNNMLAIFFLNKNFEVEKKE